MDQRRREKKQSRGNEKIEPPVKRSVGPKIINAENSPGPREDKKQSRPARTKETVQAHRRKDQRATEVGRGRETGAGNRGGNHRTEAPVRTFGPEDSATGLAWQRRAGSARQPQGSVRPRTRGRGREVRRPRDVTHCHCGVWRPRDSLERATVTSLRRSPVGNLRLEP